MLLAIDAGNTNVVFALFDADKLVGQWRISTNAKRTSDEYGVWLTQVMQHHGVDASQIKAAIAASVIPQAVFDLRTLTKRYFGVELMVVGEGSCNTGMEVVIDNPREVGADRLVNAVAAWKKYAQPLIVVDFGTATTFDVVNRKGQYAGGVIAPGVNLSLDALQKAAAKLPNVSINRPGKVVATNTIAAMQSGIYYGYVGLIEGITQRICEEQGEHLVVATGGLAELYSKSCGAIDHVEPDLTIMGLQSLHAMNAGGS